MKPSWFSPVGTVQCAMPCCAALCVQVDLCPVTAACKVRVSFSVITLDLNPGISGSKPKHWKEQAVVWGIFAGMWGQGCQADLSASPCARLAASAAKGGAAPPSFQTDCQKCTQSFLLSALTAYSSSLHSSYTRMKSHRGAEAFCFWQRISFPWK